MDAVIRMDSIDQSLNLFQMYFFPFLYFLYFKHFSKNETLNINFVTIFQKINKFPHNFYLKFHRTLFNAFKNNISLKCVIFPV